MVSSGDLMGMLVGALIFFSVAGFVVWDDVSQEWFSHSNVTLANGTHVECQQLKTPALTDKIWCVWSDVRTRFVREIQKDLR